MNERTFFNPDAGGEAPPAEDQVTPPAEGDTPPPEGDTPPPAGDATDLPEWISDKYRNAENPIEEQAKAYTEAQRRLATKTEDLRAELAEEVRAEIEAEFAGRVPDEYEYPEGWEAPTIEGLDSKFKEWAKTNGVSQDAFNELVELYGATVVEPDLDAERAKLGDAADDRIAEVNRRASRAIPEDMHETAMVVMQTAEGFQLVEHLLGLNTQRSPSSQQAKAPTPKNVDELRSDLRSVMNNPAFGKGNDEGKRLKAEADRIGLEIAKRMNG